MNKKILSITEGIVLSLFTPPVFAAGYPVFDVSGWLTAVDQLYQQYDLVMNTITTIENQYQQIQQAVERAKSIDWENISFDGDFDIRNDIKDADKRINSLLNQSRRIKETLTLQSINCGNGNRYSIADLCGMGDSGKSFFTAVTDTEEFMTENMKNTVKNLTEGLTDKQKKTIWMKYGISPENYLYAAQSAAKVKEASAKVLAKTTDEAVQLRREEMILKSNAIMQAAYSQTDSYGNMTNTAAAEASLHLKQQMVEELGNLQESVNDLAAVTASKLIAEENERQAEADERKARSIQQQAFDNRVPDSFIR